MQTKLINEMIAYEEGVPQRIHHFLKVYGFAKTIGVLEVLDAETQQILEAAAIVHDIGIRPSLEKYGSDAGPYQEREGVAPAHSMLSACGYSPAVVERVCYLVAHHHTYRDMDGVDYQILVEADFLVNLYEGNASSAAIRSAYEHVFRTETGKRFCRQLFFKV